LFKIISFHVLSLFLSSLLQEPTLVILRPSLNVCKHLEQHLPASWRWADITVISAVTVYKK